MTQNYTCTDTNGTNHIYGSMDHGVYAMNILKTIESHSEPKDQSCKFGRLAGFSFVFFLHYYIRSFRLIYTHFIAVASNFIHQTKAFNEFHMQTTDGERGRERERARTTGRHKQDKQ